MADEKRTVYKYTIPGPDCVIEMPCDAYILTMQMQRGEPCIWAMVTPDADKVQRHFVMRGTGHQLDDWESSDNYIGTFQTRQGLVFHLFEKME